MEYDERTINQIARDNHKWQANLVKRRAKLGIGTCIDGHWRLTPAEVELLLADGRKTREWANVVPEGMKTLKDIAREHGRDYASLLHKADRLNMGTKVNNLRVFTADEVQALLTSLRRRSPRSKRPKGSDADTPSGALHLEADQG
jgi:hypothetical protein